MKALSRIVQTLIAAVIAVALIGWRETLVGWSAVQDESKVSLVDDRESEESIEQGSDGEQQQIAMIERVSIGVVGVIAYQDIGAGVGDALVGKRKLGGGSGFLVDREGYIMTSKHVVDDSRVSYAVVLAEGSVVPVEQIRLDPLSDLAILKVSSEMLRPGVDTIPLASVDDTVQRGQIAIALGDPTQQGSPLVMMGVISSNDAVIDLGTNASGYTGIYQTDMLMREGYSGGPLVDSDGKVIGVHTASSAIGERIGFATPVTDSDIAAMLAEMEIERSLEIGKL